MTPQPLKPIPHDAPAGTRVLYEGYRETGHFILGKTSCSPTLRNGVWYVNLVRRQHHWPCDCVYLDPTAELEASNAELEAEVDRLRAGLIQIAHASFMPPWDAASPELLVSPLDDSGDMPVEEYARKILEGGPA